MGAIVRFCVRWAAILAVMAVAACGQATATVAPDTAATSSTTLSIKDNGGTFTYPAASRFGVFLDKETYPYESFVCTPDGVIQQVAGTTGLYDPGTGLYGVGFEAEAAGTCVLTNGDFSV